MNARICFIHIPKTAGSSFRRMLEKNYFDTDIFDGRTMLGYEGKEKKDMESFKLYLGHLYYYRALEILPDDVAYVTLLRDPVSRVKSLYYFWRSHSYEYINDSNIPEIIRRGPKLAKKFRLPEFLNLDEPFIQQAISNSQARQLWPDRAWVGGERKLLTNMEIKERLVDTLGGFAVVGVQELFPFFIYKVNRRFFNQGLFIDDIVSENKAKEVSNQEWNDMTGSEKEMVVDAIMSKNTLDYQIYKWVYNRNILELNELIKSKLRNPTLYK